MLYTNTTGAGIPVAADIALGLGILSTIINPVPLVLFLPALAVIDCPGAILLNSVHMGLPVWKVVRIPTKMKVSLACFFC